MISYRCMYIWILLNKIYMADTLKTLSLELKITKPNEWRFLKLKWQWLLVTKNVLLNKTRRNSSFIKESKFVLKCNFQKRGWNQNSSKNVVKNPVFHFIDFLNIRKCTVCLLPIVLLYIYRYDLRQYIKYNGKKRLMAIRTSKQSQCLWKMHT